MILQRLYELAQREKLLEDPAFVQCPISCSINISSDGKYLGITDLRERIETPGKGKRPPRVRYVGGLTLPVPVRPVVWDTKSKRWKTTDPAASGAEKPAVFLADSLPRVVNCDSIIAEVYKGEEKANKRANEIAKYTSQRSTFWKFIEFASGQIGDDTLRPFVIALAELSKPETVSRLDKHLQERGFGLGDLCTFSIREDGGPTVLVAPQRGRSLDWWREFHAADQGVGNEGKLQALCQVTRQITAIGDTVKTKIEGLTPIGCRADAYLVTGLDSAESYGFAKAAARMVSAQGIEGFTRPLNALIAGTLVNDDGSTCITSLRVGGTIFLYWTIYKQDSGFMNLFEDPAADPMKQLVDSVHKGRNNAHTLDASPFYLLALSGNSKKNAARVAVRGYLETKLHEAKANVAKWFDDLRIADTGKDYSGTVNDKFRLKALAAATIPLKMGSPDWEKLPERVSEELMTAALKDNPVSDAVLIACLHRITVEGSEGFRPARMALIKLILIRKGIHVDEQLVPDKPQHAAYVYGRFLAICEEIQRAALGKVNTNIVDRFYGRLSTAPALILRRMIDGALDHLKKVRTTKEALHRHLDERLALVVGLMPADPLSGQMSFEDQARFSIGYYHEKAASYKRIADRKREKAEAAEKAASEKATKSGTK